MNGVAGGLRLVIIGINYAPEVTGIARYTSAIASGLSDRGHDVRVLTTRPHYPQWRVAEGYHGFRRRELLDGVDVRRLRHYVPNRPQGVRRALSEISFGLQAVTTTWGNPDVIICPSPALLSSAMVQLRSRAAFGLQVQDLYSVGMSERSEGGRVTAALASAEARVARRADGVAVIHDRFRTRMVEQLGVEADRVRVIRNWTRLTVPASEGRTETRRRLGWGDECVVLHSGAMGEKQGLRNVVEAARLADVEPGRVRFVLMGDGGQRSALESAAQGVSSLDFLDPVPDGEYAAALQAADVLLVNELPGIREMAVPSKLTSYFSTGRPVLAAVEKRGTTAQEVAAAGAGLRVDPGDPIALLAATHGLADDSRLATKLGKAGPSYCEKVLGETAALDAYDEWVHELVDRRRLR